MVKEDTNMKIMVTWDDELYRYIIIATKGPMTVALECTNQEEVNNITLGEIAKLFE